MGGAFRFSKPVRETWLLGGLSAVLLGVLGVLWVTIHELREAQQAFLRVAQSHQASAALEDVLAGMYGAISGVRDHVLTSNPADLELYHGAQAQHARLSARLAESLEGSPPQHARAQRLAELVARRMALLDDLLQV